MSSSKYYASKYRKCLDEVGEVGTITSVTPPLVFVSGIPGAFLGEVVYFEEGALGQVMSLSSQHVEVLLLDTSTVSVGGRVARSGQPFQVPVSESLLGSSVNPLGKSLYPDVGISPPAEYTPLEKPSPGISAREKITEAFHTGVSVVDLLIPLGKGQRELVLGDRKTGKTVFLLQTMLTQATSGTICIYAGVGKGKSDLRKVEAFMESSGIRDRCIVVGTSASSPLGSIYLCPAAAMSIAEYFRDLGNDVLLILDDLSTHAKVYREISLLGSRFPGRGSYPGDIFYLHSRLLERGGNFKTPQGVHSITCLPVAETVEGDISGYIQTNLMSITDGHVFFDVDLFEAGRRPAVNTFLSVTRVGRQTQSKLRWSVNREVSSFLVLYNKTLSFIHFGAELNDGIRSTLAMGDKLTTFFDQPMGKVYALEIQVFVFILLWSGMLPVTDSLGVSDLLKTTDDLYRDTKEFKDLLNEVLLENHTLNEAMGLIGKNIDSLAGHYSRIVSRSSDWEEEE
jgi:F-type H+/Na+-transporting ATPase subunit alpha